MTETSSQSIRHLDSTVSALSCTTATASLYQLSAGKTVLPAMQTVPVASDGSFKFTGIQNLGVAVSDTTQITGIYFAQVNGCGTTYARLITSTQGQDISIGSTLAAFIVQSSYAANVTTADHNKLSALNESLSAYVTFPAAYAALTGTFANQFQTVFGVSATSLLNAYPLVVSMNVPLTMHEGESAQLAISTSHWNIEYSTDYVWELDGNQIASSANPTFTPNANSQGKHVVSVFWGQDDGSGNLDQTKPFGSRSFQVTISNDLPAKAPTLSLVTPNVNTPMVTLLLNTGVSLANCASFSALAITEDIPIAPSLASQYTINCTQAPTQNLFYTLLNGPGARTLYLWGIDSSGNSSTALDLVHVVYSTATPLITISQPSTSGQVFQNSVALNGTCDQTAGDVTLSGDLSPASMVVACVSGGYSAVLTLAAPDGSKSITAAQTNIFGTTGSSSVSVIRDTTPPTVLISSTSPASTNVSPLPITVTFSEPVTGFTAEQLTLGNSTLSGFSGSGTTYTFNLLPSGQGTVTVDIAAGSAQDAAGNPNLQAPSFSAIYDTIPPTVTMASTATDPTRNSPIPITVSFSEPVGGFSLANLTLVNAVASGLAGSGANYTFNLTPSSQGAISVSINAGAASDGAGNLSLASANFSRVYDSVAPTLALTSSVSDPTDVTPIPVTATFSESVTGFSLSSIAVTNGMAASLAGGGSTYTFNVTPAGNGLVTIRVNGGAAQDSAGNLSAAPTPLTRTFNSTHPSAVLSSSFSSPTNQSPFPITATFSESVTGFTLSGITVSNGSASLLSGSGTTYNFSVTPSGQGAVQISLAAGVAQDTASNPNTASNILSITYDNVAPSLSLTSPASGSYVNLGNQSAFMVSGTCSAAGQNVNLQVGAVSGSATCSGTTFSATLDLHASADGALTLTANLTDAAGNAATPATVALTKDTSTPTATLAGVPASPSNTTALNVTVAGSKVVSYIYKVGATVSTDCTSVVGYSALMPIATPVTNNISALADGNITLCTLAQNPAGNMQPYSASTSASWNKVTSISPFSGLAISPASPGNSLTPTISGASEAGVSVQLFAQASCGGTALNSETASADGTFSLIPTSSIGANGTYTFSVLASDTAGNTLCSNSLAYTLNTTPPTVQVTTSAPAYTNTSPIPVTITFSEPVTGFSTAGLNLINGTAGTLSGSGANYSLNVTPSGQGAVTLSVQAAAAQDAALNNSSASNAITVTYDTVAPIVTLASPANGTYVNTSAVTVAGSCETGLTVAISGSGVSSSSNTFCASSAYSVSVNLSAGDGSKNITIGQTDLAGNSTSVSHAIVLDTVPPALVFTSGAVQNQISAGNFATFSGSCETGLLISVAGGVDTSSTTCASGSWTYTTVSQSSDAVRTYTFAQTDAAGNKTLITGTWQRYTTPPGLTLTSPPANTSAQSGVTLSGACATGISISISGAGALSTLSTPCNSSAYSQFVYFSAGDGSKTISLSQTDPYGNNTTLSSTFVRDTTPPSITQTAMTSPAYTNTNSVTFGGACEAGLSVQVTGADTSSTPCTSGAWSYVSGAQTSDGSRVYTFSQTDAAGNLGQISATWNRVTTPPTFAFTSSASSTTSSNSVTFAGTCGAGYAIAISGAETNSTTCVGGFWTYSTNQTTDGVYNYLFSETDQAGNVATLNGTWERSTSGPTITITQSSPQISTGNTLTISGTCSGGPSGSNGTITVSGPLSDTTSCSSTTSTVGTWSYNATQSADGSYNYTFTVTDNFTNPRSSSATLNWQRDTTPPVAVPGSFSIDNGSAMTGVVNNPVTFSATDNISNVSQFCLKTLNSPPLASDSCWYPVNGPLTNITPSNSLTIANFEFNIGLIPTTVNVYLWLMDGAGNISINTGVSGADLTSITYNPVAPPSVSTVLVGNTDTMNGATSERIIPGGSDVYIRWTASGPSLGTTPVSLSFSSDDATWTTFQTALANGQNNCASVRGSGTASTNATGCFRWVGGSPSGGYYRVRVSIANAVGGVTFANSSLVNVSTVQVLAGNTETGLNSSAFSALFFNFTNNYEADTQSLAVHPDGRIFFRDRINGIVYISPADGKVHPLVPLGASTSGVGDGGSVANAQLRMPMAMVMDFQNRLLVLDYDRIRRIDINSSPATITTLIGGGSSTADSVPVATNLSFAPYGALGGPDYHFPIRVLPNGNIYFYSDSYYMYNRKRIRVYNAANGQVNSIYTSGSYNFGGYMIPDLTKCGNGDIDINFDPVSSNILNMYVQEISYPNYGCATPEISYTFFPFQINPTTGAALASTPSTYPGDQSQSITLQSMDGNIYRANRTIATVAKYSPSANTWTVILGITNTIGHCADGTAATSCAINLESAWVDAFGQLYFTDSGTIRTISNGNVVTIAGQSLIFGDGGLATNARLGEAAGIQQRTSNGRFVVLDDLENVIREFPRGGNISRLAGTGFPGNPDQTNPAANQPIYTASGEDTYRNFVINPTTDALYFKSNENYFSSLNYSTNVWSIVGGNGSVAAGDPSTSGATGPNWADNVINQIVAYDGTHLLGGFWQQNVTWWYYVFFGQITVSDNSGTLQFMTNPGGGTQATADTITSLCANGSTLSSCLGVPYTTRGYNAGMGIPLGSWDPINSQYIILDLDQQSLRTLPMGGVIGTLVVLPRPIASYVYTVYQGDQVVYYCAADGRLYKNDVTAGTDVALNWPVASLSCIGNSMALDPSTHTLIFPFTQNGVSGVGEHLAIDP